MLFALLAIVLTLILVVGIHELGHALAAQLFGVKIKTVSIGFGKPMFKWQGKNCQWQWAIWPIGGFVQLLNSRVEPVAANDDFYCIDKKPIAQRIIVYAAGGIANFLLAFTALFFFFYLGYQQQIPLVKDVQPKSIAFQAGLKMNDRFHTIDQYPIKSWQDVAIEIISGLGKKELIIDVERPGEGLKQLLFSLDSLSQQSGKNIFQQLGFKPNMEKQYLQQIPGLHPLDAFWAALAKMQQLLIFFFIILKQLITGWLSFSMLLGPLGLLTASVLSLKQGLAIFLFFIAHLSLAVGLVNLFPIPGLDGGSIVYALVEKIRKKPMSVAMEILLYRLAMIFFVVLLIQLLLNDLHHYFT